MPTAKQRIEGLQKQFHDTLEKKPFGKKELDTVATSLKQIIATRKAVNAKQGGKGLKIIIDNKRLAEETENKTLDQDIIYHVIFVAGLVLTLGDGVWGSFCKQNEPHTPSPRVKTLKKPYDYPYG